MKINKKELAEALEKVKPGLANSELIEQSTSFAFLGNRVVTYNDEISISHPISGLNLTGAIKAQSLYEFLNKIKKEEINIEIKDNSQVVIQAGRSKAGFIIEQEIRLPIDEFDINDEEWQEIPANMINALKFCYPCTSRDMSRAILTCVNVKKNYIEATDSYQLIKYTMDEPIPFEFLIPNSSVKELCNYSITHMIKSDNWVHFKTNDGTIFSSRIIDGEFPDTSAILETEGLPFQFPDTMKDAINKAKVFTKDDTLVKGDIPTVTIKIQNKRLKVYAKNNYSWFEEVMNVEYDGNPFQFAIGIDFLASLFDKMKNCIIGENKIKFQGDHWEHVIAMQTIDDEKE